MKIKFIILICFFILFVTSSCEKKETYYTLLSVNFGAKVKKMQKMKKQFGRVGQPTSLIAINSAAKKFRRM